MVFVTMTAQLCLCVKAATNNGIKTHKINEHEFERLLPIHEKTPGFLASGREEFNPGPDTRLGRSELLCNRILLKYKRDRKSF